MHGQGRQEAGQAPGKCDVQGQCMRYGRSGRTSATKCGTGWGECLVVVGWGWESTNPLPRAMRRQGKGRARARHVRVYDVSQGVEMTGNALQRCSEVGWLQLLGCFRCIHLSWTSLVVLLVLLIVFVLFVLLVLVGNGFPAVQVGDKTKLQGTRRVLWCSCRRVRSSGRDG